MNAIQGWVRKLFHRPMRSQRRAGPAKLGVTSLEAREVPASMYDVQWLGTLSPTDNFSSAQGINDLGQVVGNSWLQDANGIPGQEKAFSWSANAGLTDLGVLDGNAAYAWDVGNNGTITGWYHFPVSAPGTTAGGGYYEWAAIWENGGGHTIPGYGQIGMYSVAYGVNDANVVVGHADIPGAAPNGEAFKYDGNTLTFLGTLGGKWSYGMDINNAGYVAGFADTGENPTTDPNAYVSRYHAAIWSPDGVIHDLGTFGTDSYAYKINASGQAVGSSIGADGFYHAFFYNGTSMMDLGGTGANSEALSINNAGQVVGDTGNWLNSTAFLYENGTMYDLNTLLNAAQPGDTLARATDINNLGQIVGHGMHNGVVQAFVLSPVGMVLPPQNQPPSADAGGPYTIVAGDPLMLDASKSSDPDGDVLSFTWDINGDGVYGDAVGVNPVMDWPALQALNIAAGNTYGVAVQVNDGQGHTDTATTTLTVDVPPQGDTPIVTVSGPTDGYHGVMGQLRTLELTAQGGSTFEYFVDWGDGEDESVYGGDWVEASHMYELNGVYLVTVTAMNEFDVESAPATVTLDILQVEQQGEVTAVGGTAADDVFTISAGATAGTLATPYGTFKTTQVRAYGGNGEDKVVVQGGKANDSFGINPSAIALGGFIVEGDAIEKFVADGQAGNDNFYINGGGLPGASAIGGLGNDRFYLTALGALSGRIDGGAGADILDYSTHHSPVTVNLQNATATDTGGFLAVEGFVGSNLADTIIGADRANAWAMNGFNSGTVNGTPFSSFETWVGGALADNFRLANTRYVSGMIDGGAGSNTLDYSTFSAAIAVDLNLGTATGAKFGIANIANVIAGSGNDVITGNGGDNIFLGNAGADVINGGAGGNDIFVGGAGNDALAASAGRNLMIGGAGADTLTGGADDDLLIGGTTSFDASVGSLMSLLAEWSRTDQTYDERIAHLTGVAGGNNGKIFLKSTTVKNDRIADSLTGQDGRDWFWAVAPEAKDRQADERLN